MSHTKLVNCQYPVLAAPMNQVSNLDLALAVTRAGGLASLSLFNYYSDLLDYTSFETDLDSFINQTGHCNLLVSMGPREFFDNKIIELLISRKVSVVELLEQISEELLEKLQRHVDRLRSNGVKVLMKVFTPRVLLNVDGVILKGPDGAGRANLEKGTLEELFIKTKRKYPDYFIVVSGGIATGKQIKEYLALGADMVAVGTVFAATKESPISLESKQAIVNSNADMLSRLSTTNQLSLVFSHVATDDANHTQSLIKGITSPTEGHIFAGKGIDYITEILSVDDVMKNLTKDLYD